MANILVEKVKNAIGNGVLWPEDYHAAITASHDNPEVKEYLEGLMQIDNAEVKRDADVNPVTLEFEPAGRRAKAQAQRAGLLGVEMDVPVTTQDRSKAQAQRNAVAEKTEEPTAPEGTRFTLEDIQNSDTLKSLGVVAGDRYVGDEIIRVFSDPKDNIDTGIRLKQSDINASATLQELGAVAGDRVIGKELIPSNVDNAWRQFKYGFSEEQGFLADVGDFLEANIPIGELSFDFNVNSFADIVALPLNMASYSSPDELYGEGYMAATPDQRRDMIIAKKERELMHDYGQFFEPSEDSLARTTGNISAMLADPTTLAPAGQSLKGMAAIGAAYGGGSSIAKDLATTGEIDWEKAGLMTAGGAIIAPTVGKSVSVLSNKAADKSARKLQTKAQAVVDQHVAGGGTTSGLNDALVAAGINPNALAAASQRTGAKISVPNSADKAQEAIKAAVTRDHATSRIYSKTLDKYLGSIATRMGNMSEAIKARMRKFEFDTHVNTAAISKKAEPFLLELKALPSQVKRTLNKHLANGNIDAATSIMRGVSPAMYREFTDVIQPLLKQTAADLKQAGHTFTEVENYFPRLVKDYDKLRARLGKEEQGYITKQLQAYAARKKTNVNNLSTQEKSEIIDLAMRGYRQTTDGGKPSYAKQRKISQLTDDLMDEYADPEQALAMYLRNSVGDIEKRKFFGRAKSAKLDDQGRFDTDQSIGAIVKRAMDEGDLDPAREEEMLELLSARFVGGEQSPSGVASTIRDLGYMGTIANPVSAVTQLADAGIAASLNGFRHAIGSMFGTKNLKIIDLGLDDVITQELSQGSPRATAKALNKIMGVALFKFTDKLGKETLINSAFKKAQQMVKSPKGEAKFRQKIGKLYGDETESLIADLKAGEITENVKFFAFNELSDVQPISLSELPEKYLNSKNGRLLYMLKSFTLKQLDLVRNRVIGEWKKGNKLDAVKQAGLLAGYLSTANMGTQAVKDLMLGREVYADDIPDKALWALIGGFGMSEYTWDRYLSQGKIIEGTVDYLTPATPVIEAALTGALEIGEDEPDFAPVLKGVPLVGSLLYSWVGGGAENYNERQEKRRSDRRRED